jgi:hypothetical protein
MRCIGSAAGSIEWRQRVRIGAGSRVNICPQHRTVATPFSLRAARAALI